MPLERKWMRYYSMLSGAVLVKILLIVGGYFLGAWLDSRWGTYPLFLLLCVVLGAGLGISYIVYIASTKKI